MSKIFDKWFRDGSYITDNSVGVVTGSCPFKRLEKGDSVTLTSGNTISWAIDSSTITNIISYTQGTGTYRVTLNAVNTDVANASNIWKFQNNVVTQSAITTITITATSGTIYVNRVTLLNGTDEVLQLYKDFLNSRPLAYPTRFFDWAKPTDLSSEVDSKVGDSLLNDSNFEDSDSWIKGVGVSVSNGVCNFVNSPNGQSVKQLLSIPIGTRVKVTYVVESISSGTFALFCNGVVSSIRPSTAGIYTEIIDITIADGNQYIRSVGEVTGVISSYYIQELTGLVAAYNFSPNTVSKGQLLDISGNGNHGTINGALLTKDGMKFDGVDDYVDVADSTLTVSTICARVKIKTAGTVQIIVTNGDANPLLAISSLNTLYGHPSSYRRGNLSVANYLNEWIDIVSVFTGSEVYQYINGVEVTYGSTGALGTPGSFIGKRTSGDFFNGEIQDLKIYNYAFTPAQAKAYHNSFIKPTLIESFENYPVGSIANPQGTGSYKVSEIALAQGELVTNGGFDSDTAWTKFGGVTIGGGTANFNATGLTQLHQSQTLNIGCRYKVTFEISNYTSGNVDYKYNISLLKNFTGDGSKSFEWTQTASYNTVIFQTSAFVGSIDNVSVVEIPPLPNFNTGTKYLECDTAGTTAIQSKQAYGTWEWDVYKGADGNKVSTLFISDKSSPGGVNGYDIDITALEGISIFKATSGVGVPIMATSTSYIANNTWYRLKVARLKSAGVFKDIPTLQTSDCVNSNGINPYTTFTSNGRYGFNAIQLGATTGYGGTKNEISIVNTAKYLVEFDLKLNSGALPVIRFMDTAASSLYSNTLQTIEGRNSLIITASATASKASLMFRSLSTTTDYEVSGLTIRRIYDANAFAVFIKGGAYGNTVTGWTLVDTTGGSGSNPVTDSTYTTSEYMVFDLDAGDQITNIKMLNQVNQ